MNGRSSISRFTRTRLNSPSNRSLFFGIIIFCSGLIDSNPALAHGFAYKYDLPLPLNFYVVGSSSVVLISFLMLLWWGKRSEKTLNLRSDHIFENYTLCHLYRATVVIIGAFSVILLALLLCVGFFGDQNTLKNLLPVTIWVLWWVGFFYFTALCIDIWSALNPWSFCFHLAETVMGKRIQFTSYPNRLGYWPAFLLFSLFVWVELAWPYKETPATLATLISFYSLITWSGMIIYGRRSWLKYGECFSVIFTLIGKFAPLQFSKTKRTLSIQLPALGILALREPSMGLVLITILLLAGLSFDGFMATEAWLQAKDYLLNLNGLNPIFQKLYKNFGNLQSILITFGIAITFLLFFSSYVLLSLATKVLINWKKDPLKGKISLQKIVQHFVMTLLPIAIGYHIAHYLSYLLIAGQLLIPLLSDPFGLGWNLFRTNDYRINIGIINAKSMWSITVASVIIGHVLSMFLSHVRANQLCVSTNKVLIQLPIVTLMILYTGTSLWILAQPIVDS